MKKLQVFRSRPTPTAMECCCLHARHSPDEEWITIGIHFPLGAWFLELPHEHLKISPAEVLEALDDRLHKRPDCECIDELREELIEML